MKVDTNRLRSIESHLEKALAQVKAMYPARRTTVRRWPSGALQRDLFNTATDILENGPVTIEDLLKELTATRPQPYQGVKDRRHTEVKRVVDTLIRDSFLCVKSGLVFLVAPPVGSEFDAQLSKV